MNSYVRICCIREKLDLIHDAFFHLKLIYSFCFNDISFIQISETLKIRQSNFDTVVSSIKYVCRAISALRFIPFV